MAASIISTQHLRGRRAVYRSTSSRPYPSAALTIMLLTTLITYSTMTGCASAPTSLGSIPPAFAEHPAARAESGIARPTNMETHGGVVLICNAESSDAALLTITGETLWQRSFPGESITSLRLAPTGQQTFFSLSADDRFMNRAIALRRDGTTAWHVSTTSVPVIFDVTYSHEGERSVRFALPTGPKPSTLPLYEVLSAEGEVIATVDATSSALFALSASDDFSHIAVCTSQVHDDESDEAPDSAILHYQDDVLLGVSTRVGGSLVDTVGHGGSRVLQVLDGTQLSMRAWDSSSTFWTAQEEYVAGAQFSRDDHLVLTLGMRSMQEGTSVTYVTAITVRDVETGEVVWHTEHTCSTGVSVVNSPDLDGIAVVPWGDTSEPAILYQRSDNTWEPLTLPSGTVAACFTDEGRPVLADQDGGILFY
ncbi:MAG: hypothetical protein RBS17_04660 [Coriobacteriia bacterium]|nr:hypothetical protein [Coriobacteriia bacterium]